MTLANLKISPAEVTRELARRDPVWWIEEHLGEYLWSKQREIIESVRDNRYTAVRSAHGTGKSWLAARLVCWWIESHRPGEAFAITTARTHSQVQAVLWREIGRAHAQHRMSGRTNQTEWHRVMPEGNEEIVAIGRKPKDFDPEAFQGIHERYVLVVIDEAAGIPEILWGALRSLVANEDSRMLAIGNPTDPGSEFAESCKPGSGYAVHGISVFDSPNFTGEKVPKEVAAKLVSRIWEEETRQKYGEHSAYYVARALGKFPQATTDGLIPLQWVIDAQERSLEPGEPSELGCDVGGGGDKSVIAHRRGGVVRIVHRDQNPDTMQTCGTIIQTLRETGAERAKIDTIGIGKGVVDRGVEQGEPFVGVNVAESARDSERFLNLRAEGYWALRERFESGEIDLDPEDSETASQLIAIKYKTTSAGKHQIEKKEDTKRRLGRSPDDADAIMLCFLQAPTKKKGRATWGS